MESQATLPTEAKTPAGFLHLPYEIRWQIYRLILLTRTTFDIVEKPTFLKRSYWFDFFPREAWYSKDPETSDSGDGHEDDGEISGEEDIENQADEQVGDIDGGDGDSSDGGGSADEDGEASNADRQEIPDDIWAEEPQPSLERMGVIRGLLLTSRLVREEALDVLYCENVFCINVFEKSHLLEQCLSAGKMQRVQHLMLVLRPRGHYCVFTMEANVWDIVLPHLKTLRLVAMQTVLAAGEHYTGCTAPASRKSWVAAFGRVLECVGSKLPASAALLTDIDGLQRQQSLALLEWLSHPQQRIRTKIGDRIFKRSGVDKYQSDADRCIWCAHCYRIEEMANTNWSEYM